MAILADSINNNGIYAVRAEADMDGNRIDLVYAKKTEIPSKTSDLTNDSNFVTSSDLATVAETGSYTDLSNKPDLSVYATTSAMETALAGKQATIPDIDSIRAGAAAGATAAQPSDLPSSDELLPSATSSDAGKVLTVGNDGTASWITPSAGTVYTPGDGIDITNDVISADVDGTTIGIDSSTKKIKSLQVIPTKTSDLTNDSNFVVASSLATVATSGSYADLSDKPAIPSVDQTYNASSTNAQSGTAVAQAIAAIPSPSVDEVPAVTSSDDGKVLTASYSGGQGSYSWQTAQGGGAAVEAGDGLEKIAMGSYDLLQASVSLNSENLLRIGSKIVSDGFVDSCFAIKSSDLSLASYFRAPFGISLELTNFYYTPIPEKAYMYIADNQNLQYATNIAKYTYSDVSFNIERSSGQQYTLFTSVGSFKTIGLSQFSCTVETGTWAGLTSNTTVYVIFGFKYNNQYYQFSDVESAGASVVSDASLMCPNPLPASAQADSGKVLKVNASGNAEWGTDGFTTTAGITDIQVVNSLPASPVATVLYLLPET